MTKEEIYAAWNPPDSPWTPWCKSVLFSYLPQQNSKAAGNMPRIWEMPPTVESAAIIADVAGADGVSIGLSLCLAAGFRPIPLYNACPFATYDSDSLVSSEDFRPALLVSVAVDLSGVMSALASGGEFLAAAKLPANAPPAFLIDGIGKAGIGSQAHNMDGLTIDRL